jgi:subtilisin family serine protease/PKD repeat protein
MRKSFPHRFLGGMITILLLLALVLPAQAAPARLDPGLVEYLAAAPGGRDSFLVLLKDQADLSGAPLIAGRTARVAYVYGALRSTAERSQAGLRADLAAWGVPYHPFYIVNAIQVTGDLALARKLAGRPEVARLVADPSFNGIDDPPGGPPAPPAVDAVEWNIARVHAPDVWALGYTGQGIVVGSVDTGVEYTHPALVNQYRGNLGGGNFDHNYNWAEPFGLSYAPYDPEGHGTHTTGTMVGDDGAGNQVGMAPGAEWIACKADSDGVWRASKYIACWEWMLAPTDLNGNNPNPALAAHVINNSWSCPGSEGCDLDTILPAAQALYAAGIAIAKSGGNTGPNCSTITNPGQYAELLATAAFAQGDTIASFSSRGPVTYQGELRIKPDIAAPGSGVRSAYPGGGYSSLSGTSMASPHTAGLVALLWSARPALIGDLAATYQVIRSSAEPKIDLQCVPNGPGGRPNNVWGWGIMDALAAVQDGAGLGTLHGIVYDNAFTPVPGAGVEIVQTDNSLRRTTIADANGAYTLTVLAATYDVTATHYGYFPGTVTDVVVNPGGSTAADLVIDRAPGWALSGTVTDANSGAPLRATLALLGTPVSVSTDPVTGFYTTTAAEGSYTLRASSPGYVPQERAVTVTGNLTGDFALLPEPAYALRDSTLPCGPAFNWLEISGSGQPYNLQDDAYAAVTLPRPFAFYGQVYTNLYVGSNGQLTFALTGANYPGGNAIPDPFLPNNAIYAFWDDLNPASGSQGTIYTELVDGRYFVIEYDQVEHFSSGSPETFEVVLDLDTGVILLQYLVVNDTRWTTVGLENSAGTAGLSYAFHDPAWPTSTQALALIPFTGEYPFAQGAGLLGGTVVETPTLAPIPGAEVTALDGSGTYTTTTDASGAYTLPLCAGLYTVTASAAGYFPSLPEQVAVYSDTTTVRDFFLAPSAPCEPVQGADFSWDPLMPAAGQVVTFTGAASGTPPVSYTWDLGDGAAVIGPSSFTHIYAAPGVYTVLLTATNCATATATAVHTVTVVGAPQIVLPTEIPPVGLDPGQQAFLSFPVANSGTAGLEWSLAEVPDAPWLEESPAGSAIAPGGSTEVLLTYTAPLTPGIYTAVLRISSNDPLSPSVDLYVEMDVTAGCVPITQTTFSWTPLTPGVGSPASFAATARGAWWIEPVDVDGRGDANSLALDSAGLPHLSYAGENYDLLYAHYNGTAWVTETVDRVQRTTSLAVDASGHPHIAYNGGTLRYASHDGTSWITQTVAYMGLDPALVLDAAGRPHIAYTDAFMPDVSTVKYAFYDGTTWHIETVDAPYAEGPSPLALDSAGLPHISYYDRVEGSLKYAWYDGTAWHIETADPQGRYCTSLALDGSDRPHIACGEEHGFSLRYVHFDGTAWHTATVDAGPIEGRPSIATDAAGRPRIAYFGAGTVHTLFYAAYDGSAWLRYAVDDFGLSRSTAGVGWGISSLALDAAGRPHIAYYHDGLGQTYLHYAHLAQPLPTPPITYTWDFGDGNMGSGETVQHTFAAAGTYTVTVTAANGCGQATATGRLTVVHRIYLPLVARAYGP